ncbi:uncharacterized protein LOC142170500 [Nicotiana tabacum]|uniref:Uncharacterized protein LOC142170500 n=1 Tax=Nicotiana tabacum TaxID=4097 RepID=A0AC58SU73_TOBAC
MYSTNAYSAWTYLKEIFDKKNLTRFCQLLREICTTSQGSLSVSEYYSKLICAWDEYWSMVVVPLPCECTKHKEYAENKEQQRLVQFLMGLNETYAQARSQVLLSVPIPTLNQAYNMIMQDESQRSNRFRKNNENSVLQFDYCLMKGHTKENCYKLVGYPPDKKFNKRRTFDKGNSGGSRGLTANNVSCVGESEGTSLVGSSSGPISMPFFTLEQYHQLLKLIDKEPTTTNARVNMADMVYLLNACFSVGSETNSWVIDTGASNHMVSSLDLLTEFHSVASNSSKDLYNGRVRGIDKEKNGLYILQPAKIPPLVKVPETP